MRSSLLFTILAALVLASSKAGAGDVPPLEDGWYVDRGACPFECCVYRDWRVRQDTVLFARPRGEQRIGTAVEGQTVQALTGEVYTLPVPVAVVHRPESVEIYAQPPDPDLAVGDRFFLLTYQGEGLNLAWLQGQLVAIRTDDMRDRETGAYRSCGSPSAQCWWRIAPENRRMRNDWWVRLRLPDGTEGWSNRAENFGNKDACDVFG